MPVKLQTRMECIIALNATYIKRIDQLIIARIAMYALTITITTAYSLASVSEEATFALSGQLLRWFSQYLWDSEL